VAAASARRIFKLRSKVLVVCLISKCASWGKAWESLASGKASWKQFQGLHEPVRQLAAQCIKETPREAETQTGSLVGLSFRAEGWLRQKIPSPWVTLEAFRQLAGRLEMLGNNESTIGKHEYYVHLVAVLVCQSTG